MQRMGQGPTPCRIMLVGEAYQDEGEETRGGALEGRAGEELNRMLHEAGIMRSECYSTNLVNMRPRDNNPMNWVAQKKMDRTSSHSDVMGLWVRGEIVEGLARLKREIEIVNPDIVVAVGNLSLWALTGAWSVAKWRGSMLTSQGYNRPYKVIPIIHPRTILGQWENRAATVRDLKRVAAERGSREYRGVPSWEFQIRPSASAVLITLQALLSDAEHCEGVWIDFDLETRAGHIACAGLSWDLNHAICIPFMCTEDKQGYWRVEEEAAIVHALYRLLTHPKVSVRGQNLLYDAQYTFRHWHFIPRVKQDTMLSHHTLFAGLPKRLDFQASLYCAHYIYWKDDGKTWTHDVGEDQLWRYNCIDCVRTREVGEATQSSIKALGLEGQDAFQQAMFWPVLKAMQRGVRIDLKRRATLAMELQEELTKREEFFQSVLGHSLNPRSPLQMTKLFYTDFGIAPIYSRAKKGKIPTVTCDEEALDKIKDKEPLLRPLIDMIIQYRQIGVFLSTFILMPLDQDQRMRCSYNLAGTETFRLSSSENAFGSGGNLQNLPKGDDA